MARVMKRFGLVALLAVAVFSASSAKAQSPTSNADNSNEYNAYVYGYVSMVFSESLANSLFTDWQNTSSNANVAYYNFWWADMTAEYSDRGFQHAYQCLSEDRNDFWGDAADDFETALYCCDMVISRLQSNGGSSSRINQAQSVRYYLQIAKTAARGAEWASRTYYVYPIVRP